MLECLNEIGVHFPLVVAEEVTSELRNRATSDLVQVSIDRAGVVSEIAQAGLDSRDFLSRVEMPEGQLVASEGLLLVVLAHEQVDVDLRRVQRNANFHGSVVLQRAADFGVPVGSCYKTSLPCSAKIRFDETHAQDLESALHDVLRVATLNLCNASQCRWNRQLVAWKQDVRVTSQRLQGSVAGEVSDGLPAHESPLACDGGQAIALLHVVLGNFASFFFGQFQRTVAVPVCAVELGESHDEDAR